MPFIKPEDKEHVFGITVVVSVFVVPVLLYWLFGDRAAEIFVCAVTIFMFIGLVVDAWQFWR